MAQFAKPLVLVIVLHAEGVQSLLDCLRSVVSSNYENLNVLLVDNGSTDGSAGLVEKEFGDSVRILRLPKNLGFARGYNLALKRAEARYVVLLNDDTVVDKDWLGPMVDYAESNPSTAACQPKLRWMRKPSYFEYNGACGGMLDRFGVPFTRGRIFGKAEEDHGQYDRIVEVFWASGAAMFLRLKAVAEAGYLDETFYAHMEEIDLCWRLKLLGYRVVSIPTSLVYHLGGGTPLSDTAFLKHRNSLLILLKNYSRGSVARFLPTRIVLDVASAFYSRSRSSRYALVVLRSYFWLILNFGQVWTSRKMVQSMRRAAEGEIVGSMIGLGITFQYYLLSRQAFSDLSGLPLAREMYVDTELVGRLGGPKLLDVPGFFRETGSG